MMKNKMMKAMRRILPVLVCAAMLASCGAAEITSDESVVQGFMEHLAQESTDAADAPSRAMPGTDAGADGNASEKSDASSKTESGTYVIAAADGADAPSRGMPGTDDGVVYWTKSGKVWHTSEDCRFLANSKDVRSGTVAQSGKSDECSACAAADGGKVTVGRTGDGNSAKAADADGADVPSRAMPASDGGVVYWTKSGKVWHTTRSCSALARSKEVLSGTADESGKERVCSICGNGG